MKASGEVINISRETDAPLFRAACLGLGCLGIILTLTLQCEKAFNLHKTLQPAKLDQVVYSYFIILFQHQLYFTLGDPYHGRR